MVELRPVGDYELVSCDGKGNGEQKDIGPVNGTAIVAGAWRQEVQRLLNLEVFFFFLMFIYF